MLEPLRLALEALPRAALDELAERDRTILRMCYGLDGEEVHAQREIADQLGLKQPLVSSVVRRVTARLVGWEMVDPGGPASGDVHDLRNNDICPAPESERRADLRSRVQQGAATTTSSDEQTKPAAGRTRANARSVEYVAGERLPGARGARPCDCASVLRAG